MNIITGYTGTPHVTSNAAQGFNQGVFGSGDYVLNVGEKFAATLTDSNTVTIGSGEGIMQGVHFRVDPGTVDSVTIDNGTSGKNRIDLICARYTKNASTGVEDVSFAVVKGAETTGAPVAPAVNTGNILTGGSPVDFPMFRVTLTGINPVVEPFFEVVNLRETPVIIGPADVSNMTVEQIALGSWQSVTSDGAYYSVAAKSNSSYGASCAIGATNEYSSYTWSAVGTLQQNMAITSWIYVPAGTTFYVYAATTNGESGSATVRRAPAL